MSVSIRLRREGAKNRPYYKVVVADSRSPRDGKFIEIIGTYDPKRQGDNSTIKLDRAEHWIARGAQPSDTVRSLLKKNRSRPAAGAGEADEPAAEKTPAPKKAPIKPKPPEAEAAPAEVEAASPEAQAAPVEPEAAPAEATDEPS